MKILVTGAAGALGRNLVENLKAIRDGKNRTRPNLKIDAIYEYDRENTEEDLNRFCSDCDFIVHAAGVNRPKETSEFMEGNFGFTSTLLDCLKKHENKAPIPAFFLVLMFGSLCIQSLWNRSLVYIL